MLALACARHGIGLLTFSSDQVFGGDRESPYLESDVPAPVNVYGRSQADGEARVMEALPSALVIRTAALFGPGEGDHVLALALESAADGRPFAAAADVTVSPTYLPDLVNAALDLLIDGERGLWHLANSGALSSADLARRVVELAGLDPRLVEERPRWALGLPAPRPRYSALTSERGWILPPVDDALRRYLQESGRAATLLRIPALRRTSSSL